MLSTRYSLPILRVMKLEFSRQSFEEYSNIKFHENPSSADTHDEANSRFSQFCERA